MDPIIELTNQIDPFSQQLRMRQLANEHKKKSDNSSEESSVATISINGLCSMWRSPILEQL